MALTFDAAGNQTRITDPVGVVTSFEFDAVGNRTAEIDGLGNRVTWTYDVLGRLATTTNARGQTTSYSYDAASQLTGWTAPEGSVLQAFDAAGRRTRLEDPSGTTTFGYDAAGRLTSMASAAGTVGFGYDAAGRRTSFVVRGVTTGYTYDATGLLATVSTAAGDVAYAHDDDGRVTTVSRPNGVVSSYGYNAAARVTSIHHDRAGTPVAHFDYTVDPVGNRLAVQTLDGTESYTLDAGYRLTRVDYADGAVQEFSYDAAGNRTAITEGGHRSPYLYDAAGRLVEVDGVEVTRDADGNLTGLGDAVYAFDSANRLVGVTTADETATYTYDADGRRVHATENGVDTARLFDPTGDYPVLLGLGDETYNRDPFGDLLGVTGADGVERSPLTDALTSVRAVTDPTGSVAGEADFEAYGAVRTATGDTSALEYTGAPTDVAGLVDLNAREYAPALGQFLQRDSLTVGGPGTGGYNRSAYSGGNPSTYRDPSGHFTMVEQSTAVRVHGQQVSRSSSVARILERAQGLARYFLAMRDVLATEYLDKDNYEYLYRGVGTDSDAYTEATYGFATPYGLFSRHAVTDPVAHNEGENFSLFTSWTVDEPTAIRFSKEYGDPARGVVLRIKNENGPTWIRLPSVDLFEEWEVLILGVVFGADVSLGGGPYYPTM